MSREYILHALDTRKYTLEHADSKETVSAPTIEGLGRELADYETAKPRSTAPLNIRLDAHCEQYHDTGVVKQVLDAYAVRRNEHREGPAGLQLKTTDTIARELLTGAVNPVKAE